MRNNKVVIFVLILICGNFAEGCSISKPFTDTASPDSHERLNGVLWIQTSAEYIALSQAIYAQAKKSLDRGKRDTTWTALLEQTGNYQRLPPAIIADIDETILDNSPFSGRLIKNRSGYNHSTWTKWAKRGRAAPIPGALDFLQYAHNNGVEVLYVTNREHGVEPATRKNLENLGFPLSTKKDTILTKNEPPHNWTSDKTARRRFLARDYRILLLIGDDLGDFVLGAKSDPKTRRQLAKKYSDRWGISWFLLPNPLYGSWETSLYDKGLSYDESLYKKLERVKAFK